MKVRVARIAYPVTALGPGRRVAVWVAGCRLDCPGCITRELQDPAAGQPVETAALCARLGALPEPLEGVTVSGGEPFEQAAGLAALLARLRLLRPRWSRLAYSGYTLEELRSQGHAARRLLAELDVLIDGRYRSDVSASGPLRGSGNQRIHYLSAAGLRLRDAVESAPRTAVNLGLDGAGRGFIIGFPARATRLRLRRSLGIATEPAATEAGA